MKKKSLFWIITLVILLIPFVSATSLTDGLINAWTLTSTDFVDYVGGYNFTDSGGSDTSSGKNPQGSINRYLNTGGEYYQTGNINLPSEIIVSFWLNNTATTTGYVLSYTPAAAIDKVELLYVSGQGFYFTVGDETVCQILIVPGNNVYNHFVMWANSTHSKYYMNGVLNQTVVCSHTPTANAIPFRVGDTVNDNHFVVDELYIWNRTLTDDEILSVYNSGIGYFYPFLDQVITAKDFYDSSTINNFTVYLSNTTYNITNTTTTGIIEYDLDGLFNITIESNESGGYFNKTYLNYNISESLTAELVQSYLNFTVTNLDYNNTVLNFSIETPYGSYETNNGSLSLIGKLGELNWSFKNPLGYFNFSFSIQNNYTSHLWTISGVKNAFLRFKNNITNASISPTCTFDVLNKTGENISIVTLESSNKTLLCNLFGFEDYSILLNSTTINETLYMQPVKLLINFSEKTDGYITWENSLNGTDGVSFNETYISMNQDEIGLGYVSIVFNNGQQLYEYYNDGDTTIRQNLKIITPDTIQPLILWDGIQSLFGLISVYKLVNVTFVQIYSTYTNLEGESNVLIDDGNTYKFCGTVEGYDTQCQLNYIEPSSETTATTTIYVLVEEEQSSEDDILSYQSSCTPVVEESTVCTITASANEFPYEWKFIYNNSVINSTEQIESGLSSTLIFSVNNVTGVTNIDIYVDGEIKRSFQVEYENRSNREVQIGFEESDKSWIYENIIVFVLCIFAVAVFIGVLIEQKIEGWGLKSTIVVFVVMGGIIVPIFYAIGLIFAIWFVYDHTKNMGA